MARPGSGLPVKEIEEKPVKILVVDDSLAMRKIIVNSLNRLGFKEVVEAGKKAFETLSTGGGADLILTDWNMPEMSGLELIQAVRENDALKKTPVLMITTNSAKEEVVEALKAGVNNYLVKPFTPETMKEKILAVIPNAC
jgi:two-component system chemotaxis response regulator CheY